MDKLTLVIGNKNYSSWSLRPWLLMKYFRIPFAERRVSLYTGNWQEQIKQFSPSGLVPALVCGELVVWDSLAICEYLADQFPELSLWPSEPAEKALARSVSAEMHAGFLALRSTMPMNIRKQFDNVTPTIECENDISRILNLWEKCRRQFHRKGDFLFGQFSVADAMYAPVVFRFQSYGVSCTGYAAAYKKTIFELPAMKRWSEAAVAESETIDIMER